MSRSISKKTLKRLVKSERIIIAFVSLAIFSVVFYYVFFTDSKGSTDYTSSGNYEEVYQNYQDSIESIKDGVEKLLENSQIQQITTYDGFFSDVEYGDRENPFVES